MIRFVKFRLLSAAFIVAAAICAQAQSVEGVSGDELDFAIRDASDYLNDNIPKGSKIVILNIESNSVNLSEYVIDELVANVVNDKNFSVVDRRQLEAIKSEQNFQMSGAVDDRDALAIGKFFGAQTIISGAMREIGGRYRLTIRALAVQTAQVQGQFNLNMPISETLAALANSDGITTVDLESVTPPYTPAAGSSSAEESHATAGGTSGWYGNSIRKEDERKPSDEEKVSMPEVRRSGWGMTGTFTGEVSPMVSNIDPVFMFGVSAILSAEWFARSARWFRFGIDVGYGGIVPDDSVKQQIADNTNKDTADVEFWSWLCKPAVFVRLYPADMFYLSGGAGFGFYGISTKGNSELKRSYALPVISTGVGVLIPYNTGKQMQSIVLEAQFHILPGISRNYDDIYSDGSQDNGKTGWYLSFGIGWRPGAISASKPE